MKLKFPRQLILLVAGMMLTAGVSYAQSDDNSIVDQLKLTPAQQEQLKTLRERFRTETEPIRRDIKHLLEQEKSIKSKSPVDQRALQAVLKDRAAKEVDLSLALTRFNEQVEGILTSEQKEILKHIREGRKR
jgi:Spy/CpxP family protein refolding chaperone